MHTLHVGMAVPILALLSEALPQGDADIKNHLQYLTADGRR
jgi:hypothetical protein